jgi:hypothetical protein
MNTRNVHQALIAFLFASHFALPVKAAFIPGVTISAVSSEYPNDSRRATNLVNNSGWFGDVVTSIPGGAMWLSSIAAGSLPGTNFVTFDLGSVHTLKAMQVWNYNEQVNGTNILVRRGIKQADISWAGEDQVFTTNFTDAAFAIAPGRFTNNFGQVFDFGAIQARYVRINVRTNHSAADVAVGLSKVRFVDTNVPPRLELAARNYSSNKVTVFFSEAMIPSSATNIANYSIRTDGTNSASILGAAMDVYNHRVVLNTTLLSNANYSLVATNVAAASDGTVITNGSTVAIEPRLLLWLRADAGVTADGSGLVSQWADQSGNGNHAVQADPGYQPTLVAGSLNGQPTLHFAGLTTTNFLDIPTSVLTAVGDLSVFVVARFDTFGTPAFHTLLSEINPVSTQPAPFDSYVSNVGGTAGRPIFLRGDGYVNSSTAGLTNVVAATGYVLSYVVRGTNAAQYLNGAFNGGVAVLAGVDDWARPVRIGARDGNAGTKLNGDLAEVMVVRGAVSDAERLAIHNNLGVKYGIPIINLVFNQQPTNTTRLEGQTATFYVNVSASSPDINYQWQRYGTNLPAATNASYTTPVLTQADNNSTFRVQVSIPGSSQFSDTATLTVLPDTEPPTVVSAGRKIWSPSEIVVVFSEAMSPATATSAGSYTLDNGAAVASAALGDAVNKVVLTASGLTSGGAYMLTVQNVKDLFNNTIVAVQVPVTVYPAAALWLSAGTGATVDNDGYITQWNDLSGNGNNATPTFGVPFTAQVITNGFNGRPVARFDGTNSVSLFAPSSPSLAIVGDMSIYAVASFVDYVNFNSFVGKTTVNLPASYDFYLVAGTGEPRFYRGNGSTSAAQVTGTIAPSLGVPHIVSVVMGGTSVAHFLDGAANGTGTLAATLGDNGDPLGIGTRNDGATKLKGDVAELFVFGSALSSADRAALDSYFGAKYGIAVGSLPGISIAANPGGTVLLSWPTPVQLFDLESATNIVAGPWATVTNDVTSSGGTNSATINSTGSQQFFRLHKR